MSEMKKIAGDISKLLEEVKVKPIVLKENVAPTPPPVDIAVLSREVATATFANTPAKLDEQFVGNVLLGVARKLAEQHKVPVEDILEGVAVYCNNILTSAAHILENET